MIAIGDELPDFRQYLAQLEGQFPNSHSEDAEAQAENQSNAMQRVLTDRGVPKKLAREVARVEGSHAPQRTRALECALGWWALGARESGRDIIVLSGDRGRGKSYAAAQVIAQAKASDYSLWTSGRRLVDLLHARDMKAAAQIARVRRARVAVIDDLGWEHLDQSGYALSAVVGILDDRIQDELRTVCTTNLPELAFRERYGDALHDRIRGYGAWIDVPAGGSMR